MKHLFSVVALFIISVTFVNTPICAGCFPRKDIKSSFIVMPEKECFNVTVGPGCVGNVELVITNECAEVYLYEKEGNIYELSNPFYDRDVPQEYVSWQRSVYEKDNPSNRIDIFVTNTEVKPYEISQLAGVFVGLLALLIVVFVLKTFRKKSS